MLSPPIPVTVGSPPWIMKLIHHAVKNDSIVIAIFSVCQKVFDCFWCFSGKSLILIGPSVVFMTTSASFAATSFDNCGYIIVASSLSFVLFSSFGSLVQFFFLNSGSFSTLAPFPQAASPPNDRTR